MITPILKDPKAHGGTLYTFPSASRDLTRAFSNSEYEFAFSHFACLNLPDFRYGTFEDGNLKGVYLDNLAKYYYFNSNSSLYEDSDSDSLSDLVSNNLNNCLKWHLQSYVMNYEVAILNGFSLDAGKYDTEILKTPSERIFFNWLQRVGAIKFSGNNETLSGYGDDVDVSYETLSNVAELELKDKTKSYRIDNKLYTWKGGQWRSRVLVSKTVQYIGTIDMVNNVDIEFDSFNEVYLNIPSSVGGSTNVHFDNVFDTNYERDEIIDVRDDIYCEDTDYIIGRNPEELSMTNDVTLRAIYDTEYDADTGYASPIYRINSGYCINFSDNLYTGGIEGMNSNSEEDFEFNCVLIYYRIRKGNGEWQTNLYGVLFLEEVTISDYNLNLNKEDERAGYIQRYPKFKKGNSWGLKLDLKIDAQPDSQLELRDKEYSDPNSGGGMQLFAETLVQLNACTKMFNEIKSKNVNIEDRIYKLENIISGVDAVYDLSDTVGALRTEVEMFQPALNRLDGEYDDLDRRMSRIETNLGYLIRDVKESRLSTSDRINELESRIKRIEDNLNNLLND